MPEALETWPVHMMQALLPRHLEIIFEINRRFLKLVEERWPGNTQIRDAMSIVEGGDDPLRGLEAEKLLAQESAAATVSPAETIPPAGSATA